VHQTSTSCWEAREATPPSGGLCTRQSAALRTSPPARGPISIPTSRRVARGSGRHGASESRLSDRRFRTGPTHRQGVAAYGRPDHPGIRERDGAGVEVLTGDLKAEPARDFATAWTPSPTVYAPQHRRRPGGCAPHDPAGVFPIRMLSRVLRQGEGELKTGFPTKSNVIVGGDAEIGAETGRGGRQGQSSKLHSGRSGSGPAYAPAR